VTDIIDLDVIAAMIAARTGENPADIAAQLAALPDDKKEALKDLAADIIRIDALEAELQAAGIDLPPFFPQRARPN
jgi:hypothetical protein